MLELEGVRVANLPSPGLAVILQSRSNLCAALQAGSEGKDLGSSPSCAAFFLLVFLSRQFRLCGVSDQTVRS